MAPTAEIQRQGTEASRRARRAAKIAGLIESAPPLTDDQLHTLRSLIHDHPRFERDPQGG